MFCRLAICALAVLICAAVVVPRTATAQLGTEMFEDVELPDVIDDADDGISSPEELPAGETVPQNPFVDDLDQTGPQAFDAPEFNEPILNEPPELDPSLIDDQTTTIAEDIHPGNVYPENIGVGQPDEIAYETIQKRDADGNVLIERGVTQDGNQNYINHGPWKMWDTDGNLVAEGRFNMGQRVGEWSRWYQPNEAGIFSAPPFSMFAPPFQSRAAFRNGQLEGRWTISDQHDRIICDWRFTEGRRHGKSTWWYPNETRMRELTYDDGQIDGELIEWDNNGDIRTRVEYQNGRRWEKNAKLYKNGQKQLEGMVLQARLVLKDPDVWWDAKLAGYRREGKDQKHGRWIAWHPNGQLRFSGEYQFNRPSGEFTWWFTNGQKSLVGSYRDGEKTGKWVWWHESGAKSIEGHYEQGSPVDGWIWWNEQGRVAQRVDFSKGQMMVPSPQLSRKSPSLPHSRPVIVRRNPQ
ncbi:MAG: hypothetical protein GY768_13645 [Planctomycetaceae bacterium]|nr:hypothetical protein [Planctomycetaceae bacterium]